MNYIKLFKEGGIHIKKSHKGRFTSYCGGKVTTECILRGKNSSNPRVRKMATFAANARTWKHLYGGAIKVYDSNNGKEVDLNTPITLDTNYFAVLDTFSPREYKPIYIPDQEEQLVITTEDGYKNVPILGNNGSTATTISSKQNIKSGSGPRGYKNNNPTNLRISNNNWKGKIKGSDNEFETFDTMANGFRAAFINMRTHINRGENTIESLINALSPPSENPTTDYIDYVSRVTGINKNQVIDPKSEELMVKIITAIAQFENNNIQPDMNDVFTGWQLYNA